MKISFAVLTAFAVSAVHAYTPPADQPDGAYSVHFDESGNPITKRLEMIRSPRRAAAPVTEATPVERRGFPGQQVQCTGRDIPDQYDYSVVQNCLGTWLGQNSGKGATKDVYYCRKGNTLLAVCNYDYTIAGNAGEIAEFNGVMDNTCGAWRSGFVFIKDWNKTYWRTTWGETICENGSHGSQQVAA